MIVESLWVYEGPFSKNIHFPINFFTDFIKLWGALWITLGQILAYECDFGVILASLLTCDVDFGATLGSLWGDFRIRG